MRDGTLQQIDASQLVPGDVVLISIGNIVPADLKLLGEEGDDVPMQVRAAPGAWPMQLWEPHRASITPAAYWAWGMNTGCSLSWLSHSTVDSFDLLALPLTRSTKQR